jgi:hypothetical protein
MTCERAGHLLDDYLEGSLSHRDRHFLEGHLERCERCAEELRRRPAFDRGLRRALATSVQPLVLSTHTSSKIIDAAKDSLRRAQRSERVTRAIHLVSTAVAVSLLVIGILFLMGEIPVPDHLKPVALFPVNRLAFAEAQPDALAIGDGSALRVTVASQHSLPQASLLIEPRDLRPAQPFTMTVLLHSDLVQPVDRLRLDLDVSGPTGYYSFGLSVRGPLPAHGVSILRLTPELLADACEDRYLMAPTEVFRSPGTYTVRLTLSDAVVASR